MVSDSADTANRPSGEYVNTNFLFVDLVEIEATYLSYMKTGMQLQQQKLSILALF